MLPLFVNRNETRHLEKNLEQEATRFFTLYLFTKRSCFYCWISYYFPIWNDRKIWTDQWIMSISNLFNPKSEQSIEEKIRIAEYVRKIKSHKFKSPEELKYLHQYQHKLETNKQTCILNFEKLFRLAGIWEWIGLIDTTTAIPIGFDTPDLIKANEEDPLLSVLINEFTDEAGLLMLNFDAHVYFKTVERETPDKDMLGNGNLCFYNMPLFSFPFCTDLEIDKMRALRANMHTKMQTIADLTDKFISDIKNDEFNNAAIQKSSLFNGQLQPELPLMQQQIDDEVYFHLQKNSSIKYTQLTLNLCVTSISMIIDYYEISETLLPFAASALKRQLSLMTDINKCMPFLNLTASEIKTF